MKTIIILQNSPVFTVDITKIHNSPSWNLHLIVNKKSYDCLYERNQHNLFKTTTILPYFDFDSLKKAIQPIVNEINTASIVLATNSESLVLISGQLREFFGIGGLNADVARIFSDKVYMKKHLSKFDVPLPNYFAFKKNDYLLDQDNYLNTISQHLSFPMIAKPIDSAGSQGVSRINNINELKQWAISIENDNFELDQLIDGDLYHCDSFVHQGKILHTAVCRYTSPTHKFMLGYNLGSITLPDTDPTYIKLKKFNNDILSTISTNFSGVTHLEAFEKSSGDLVFLEVANRGGGAGVPNMYKKHLNVDLFSAHFLLQCCDHYQLNIQQDFYAAWLQFPPCKNITSIENLPKINSNIQLVSSNNTLKKDSPCLSLRDYSLRVILWNKEFNQLNHDLILISNHLR